MRKFTSLFIKFISVFLCAVTLTFSFACTKSAWQTVTEAHFNTVITVTVKDFELKNSQTHNLITEKLSKIDDVVSTSKENSTTSIFNRSAKNLPIEFDDLSFELLQSALSFNQNISKKFSPLIYPLVNLWQFTPEKYGGFFTVPTAQEIASVKAFCNLSQITVNAENKTVTKLSDGVKIDLGGVAKGYASDVVKDVLVERGVKEGYVSVGGSSIYVFGVPDYLSITHPRNRTVNLVNVLPHIVKGKSVSTSGDYQRFYVQNGKRYSHIIDPETGAPADTGFSSVTVIGDGGATCDMLSTALCSFTYEQMLDFISITNFSVIAVFDDGTVKKILTNKKQGDDFTLLDSEYLVVEI